MTSTLRNSVLLALMIAGAGMAWALTPRERLADENIPIELDTMVPRKFGDWTEVPASPSAVIDPGRALLLEKIYSATLSRVFVNSDHYPIMLSIAYGRDQSDGFQLHQPEVCYPAQGFSVLESQHAPLQMNGYPVPTTRLKTQGPRSEPLTYWTVVGQRAYQGGFHKKLTEMRYGLSGKIPDGMLVRISSVDTQTEKAYAIQAKFATELAAALPDAVRSRFVGTAIP